MINKKAPENTLDNSDFIDETDFISKTQLKHEAKILHSFGKELTELKSSKVQALPLMDVTKRAIEDFHKQQGHIAKKRHLAYIGKCLRKDDVTAARQMLEENDFADLRKQEAKAVNVQVSLVELLILNANNEVEVLMEEHPALNRQLLRQLIRNINKAKSEPKKVSNTAKLTLFLQQNKIFTTK